MNFIKQRFPFGLAKIWIFCAVCFVLPMNASYIYTLTALLLILWIAEGNLREKLRVILASRLCLACVAYFFVYLLAMLWTEDVQAGWRMVGRQIPFLLFPVYWSSAEPEYKERYITAFIVGLCLCALFAHYNYVQMNFFSSWPKGVRVHKGHGDTAPFVDWIMYSPILALAVYFSLRRTLFSVQRSLQVGWALVTGLLLSNLSFSGGRAGIVMFVALLMALIFERITARRKALLACLALIPLAFIFFYYAASPFADRIDRGVTDIRTFEQDPNTSVGQRLVYWTTSFKLFMQNPVLGVGSGDFATEYAKIKSPRWAMIKDIHNPHNQFLMTGTTTGLLGLSVLLSIFYFASLGDFRTKTILFGYAILCIFESYLWRSNTSLTFFVILAAHVKNKGKDASNL